MTPRERRTRLRSIHDVASKLPAVESPDLTDQILERVDRVRPFMNERDRRVVTAGRLGVLVGAGALCLSLVVTHIALTRMGAFGTQPAPLTALLDSTGSRAGTLRDELAKVRQDGLLPSLPSVPASAVAFEAHTAPVPVADAPTGLSSTAGVTTLAGAQASTPARPIAAPTPTGVYVPAVVLGGPSFGFTRLPLGDRASGLFETILTASAAQAQSPRRAPVPTWSEAIGSTSKPVITRPVFAGVFPTSPRPEAPTTPPPAEVFDAGPFLPR